MKLQIKRRATALLRCCAALALTLPATALPASAQQRQPQSAPAARALTPAEADTICTTGKDAAQGERDWAQIEAACSQILDNPANLRSVNATQGEQRGWRHFRRGVARLEQRSKPREAISDFNTAIAQNFRPWVMHTNIGKVHREQLNDAAAAERSYRAAIAAQGDFLLARLNLGILLNAAGRYRDAVTELQQAEAVARRLGDAGSGLLVGILAELGEAHYFERNLEDARTAINRALELDPSNAEAQTRLIQILVDLGQTSDIERRSADLAERNANNPTVLASVGHTFNQLRKYREASQYCTAARQLDPAHVEAAACLATALTGMGQLPRAEQVLGDASNRARDNPRLLTLLGLLQKRRGLLMEATATFQRVLQINPRQDEARHFLISTLTDRGQLGEALNQIEALLRVSERDSKAHSLRAFVFALNNNAQAALADVERVRGIVQETGLYWLTLGTARYYLGQTNDAIAALRRGLALDANDGEVLRFLARALIKSGNLREAQQILERAEKLLPFDWQIVRNRGLLELRQGRFSIAQNHFTDSIALNGAFIETYVLEGEAWEGQQNTQLAIASYQRALGTDPKRYDYDIDGREARERAQQRLAILRSPSPPPGQSSPSGPQSSVQPGQQSPVPIGPDPAGRGSAPENRPPQGAPAGGDANRGQQQPTPVGSRPGAPPPAAAGFGEVYCGVLQRWSQNSEHYTGIRIGLGCRRR